MVGARHARMGSIDRLTKRFMHQRHAKGGSYNFNEYFKQALK